MILVLRRLSGCVSEQRGSTLTKGKSYATKSRRYVSSRGEVYIKADMASFFILASTI